MANKKVWISALAKDENRISRVNTTLRRYGFDIHGHIWLDENDKLAWRAALDEFLSKGCQYWFILADEVELARPSVRYGLSLLASCLQNTKHGALPIFIFGKDSLSKGLPQQLNAGIVIDDSISGWEAKVVTKTLRLPPTIPTPYRFDVFGNDRIGQWFEFGPVNQGEVWDGIIFGVSGNNAEISFQAVGPAGMLPQKTNLNFAREGLKIHLGDKEYLGWSLQNSISTAESYYAKVKGSPDSFLLMPNEGAVQSDSPEAFTIFLN